MSDTDTAAAPAAAETSTKVVSEPSAREAELATLAEADPGVYRYSNDGALAKEHLALKQAREAGDLTDDDAGDEGDGEGEPGDYSTSQDERQAADDAEPLEVNLEVPGSVEDYIEAVADDHWAREDPLAQEYAKFLHDMDMPQASFDAGIGFVEQLRAKMQQADKDATAETKTRLKAEWGQSYSEKMSTVTAVLKDLPGDFGKLLKSARLPDGSQLRTHPAFAEAMLSLASKRGDAPPVGDQARFEELNRVMLSDVGRLQERTGRRIDGRWETLEDEMLSIRRRLDARKRA